MLITWAYAYDECDNGISLEFEQYEKGIAIFFYLKKKKTTTTFFRLNWSLSRGRT